MENNNAFPSGLPLHELPDLIDHVFFAYHVQINKFIYLNTAFERLLNISRDKVLSNLPLLLDTVHPEDREHAMVSFSKMKERPQNQQVELRLLLADKTQKWIRINAYISRSPNANMIVGIATDITADKDYSETLHKFNDKKNSILQILSHDLLGPLGNIQTSSTLLSENPKNKDDEQIMRLIKTISNNSKRSITMIRDLINEEFLETSEAAFVKQRVDIIERLRVVIDQYKQTPNSISHRFELVTSLASLYVTIDESKFTQAINNLLSNALKFTPDKGKIELVIEEKKTTILIKIRDEGIGIPTEMQPFLFDKFTKARRRGLNGEPSTGLGMSVIKTIIEWHKGQISFESTEGKGTVFNIEIPKDN
jgi:two-component system sensor histidine kinase VicK